MKLLAIETATEACSAALSIHGEILQKFEIAPQQHTRLILPMIEQLIAEAQLSLSELDGLAFGRGPGSFTGLRIAASVIQGIGFAWDLPVVPVSTLAALAQQSFNQTPHSLLFVAMDARLSEIFWAVYQRNSENIAELIGTEKVLPAIEIDFPRQIGVGIGSAWELYGQTLSQRLGNSLQQIDPIYFPQAAQIAQLGVYGWNHQQAVSAEQALPLYLRDKVAKKESER
ncbi:MAG: peptidase yeaZ [Pseudomonadota bacterium]|jgi:tRNA threonylcarbamoyladenosine biosynthesis protein TsaB